MVVRSDTSISVVVPAYNSASFIKRALDSVLQQDHPPNEVIVVDDGSTDGTSDLLAREYQTVRVIRQANGGCAAARNTGLKHATGEYVAFLDADDWFLPGKLRTQANLLADKPSLGVAHGGWRVVDADGKSLRDVEPWHDAPQLDLASWLTWKPAQLGAMLFRRNWLQRMGYFNESLKQAEDVDLLLRMSRAGCRMEWVRRPTYCYRHHQAGIMRRGALEQASCATEVLDRFFADPKTPQWIKRREDFTRRYSLLWIAWHLHTNGCATEARAHLQASAALSPYGKFRMVHEWMMNYAGWEAEAGRDPRAARRLLPELRLVAGVDSTSWHQLERSLTWWFDVWLPYLEPIERDMQETLAIQTPPPVSELLGYHATYLLFSPKPVRISVIDRFWRDALAAGLVEPKNAPLVQTLYAAAFGRSLMSSRPGVRYSAFRAASRFAWSPKAWHAAWRTLHPLMSDTLWFGQRPTAVQPASHRASRAA